MLSPASPSRSPDGAAAVSFDESGLSLPSTPGSRRGESELGLPASQKLILKWEQRHQKNLTSPRFLTFDDLRFGLDP